jgi:hypothetical protein
MFHPIFKPNQRGRFLPHQLLIAAFAFVASVTLPQYSFAFLSFTESAELIGPGHYQFGVEPQLINVGGSGLNANVNFDYGIADDSSGRVSLSTGADVDFMAFGSYKWVPFPDVNNQPGIGFRGGVGVARVLNNNFMVFQGGPVFSKKTPSSLGPMVPYIAIPIHLISTKNENYFASHLAIGSEMHLLRLPGAKTTLELGMNLSRSYSYLSVLFSFPFEGRKGY